MWNHAKEPAGAVPATSRVSRPACPDLNGKYADTGRARNAYLIHSQHITVSNTARSSISPIRKGPARVTNSRERPTASAAGNSGYISEE